MSDVFTELAVKLRGPNPGSEEAQVVADSGGALQVLDVGSSYDEDSVHTSGDSGSFVLAVRNDTLSALAGTDGDYAPFQVNASGALYVDISNASVTVDDGGGTISIDDGGGSITVDTSFEYPEDSIHTTGDIGAFVLAVRNDAGTALAADGDYIPFSMNSDGDLRVAGTFMAGNEYPEDSVHTSGDTGGFVLSVRNDTLASLVDADGDYAPFQVDALGALYVNISNASVTIDDGGSTISIDDGGGSLTVDTGFEYPEDSVHTTADVGAFVLGVRNDTLASLVDADGDYAPFQMNADGALYIDASSSGNVDVITNYEYAEDSVHTTADVGAFVLAVRNDAGTALAGTDGDYIPFSTDATGALRVTGGTTAYAEDSIHTSGDSGNFVLAVRNDTLASLVDTDGDYAPFQVDASGALYVTVDSVSLSSEYAEDSIHTSGDIGQFILAVRNDSDTSMAADGDYTPLQTDSTGRLKVDAEFNSAFDYPEDSPHTSGDQGAFVLTVRDDVLAASTTADGDYQSFKTDGTGRLWTHQIGTYAEDSVHTSADDGTFILGVRNDTLASLVDTDGDYAPFQLNADGALYIDASSSGNVDVITNYEYAEDSVHTTADIGAFVLAVRNDTGTVLAGTDGDYIPFSTDATGALRVTGGTTAYAEDSIHTSADTGQFVLSVRNDTLASLVDTDGDYAPFQVDALGALYVNISNTSVTVDDGGGTISIDDGGGSITVDTGFEYAEDSLHTTADIGAFVLAVRNDAGTPLAGDGDYIPFSTDATGALRVTGGGGGNSEYAEDSIHTSGDTGNFVLSVRNDTLASLVDTDGDYAPFQVDALGALYVNVANTTDIAVATNYEYAEDSIHTSADVGAFVLAVRNDAGTPLAADGDYIPLTTDASGDLRVNASVTIDAEYPEDSIHTTGDTGSFVLSVRNDTLASLVDTDGDYAPFQVDALGALYVNVSDTNYEYAEDSIHTTADVGAFVLAVRNDTLAALAGTDGDYAPFQVNADGALYVDVSDISIGHVDDSAFAVGTDEVVGSGFLFDDTATDSVDEGDIGLGRMTADRRQLMRIGGATDANRVNVDDGSMMLVDRIQDTNVEHTYGTVTSVANSSTGTITHTVPDGETFYLKQVFAASSGAPMKVTVQYDDGTVTTLGVFFYSDAHPYLDTTFDQPVPILGVSGGTDVEVVILNRAGPAQDVYATIMGRTADLT